MKLGLRIFLGYFLIVAIAAWLVLRVFVGEIKPGVRQAMEDTLVDTANVMALLASDDMASGRLQDGAFVRRLRDLSQRDVHARISGFKKDSLDYRVYITDAKGIVVFDSSGRDLGRDYSRWNDVYLTLHGRYGARSTRSDANDPNSTVMHVAAPILHDGRIIGSLTVAKPNSTIAPFIAASQNVIVRWGALLLGIAFAVGLLVSVWFAREIARLQRYARAVTAGEKVAAPRGAGEFGELGQALESMRGRLDGKQYVEEYVHSLTHEMKSPLAAIHSAAELLQESLPDADRQRFAANIVQHSQRTARMIDMLLALAALEHRQTLVAPVVFYLREVLNELVGEFASLFVTAGISLHMQESDSSAIVLGDRFLVGQALRNLLQNALDFSSRRSRVAVALAVDDEWVTCNVRDHGVGIPEFAHHRLFERFYSLPRPEGGSRSSGLGLCFVREVAQLHSGSIDLANADGGGALASLRLPRA